MTANRFFKASATLTAAALLLGGCGAMYQPLASQGYNTSQQQLIQQQQIPVLPPGVEPRGLQLEPGTTAAHVGEALRFAVAIKGSDNKLYSDPRLVNWTLSNLQLGQVDRNGILQPATPGTVQVIATIGNLSASATVQIEQARYAWQQMLSPVGSTLRTVKMVSRTEAWAGGDGGTMLRYIGGAWHREPSFHLGDAKVRGLGFANSGLGWAVGTRGGDNMPFLQKWDGYAWTAVNIPAKDGVLNAVSVVNERDVWAVGQNGDGSALVLHWNGASWLMFDAPGKGRLNDVQMLSPRLGWAVGKYDGMALTPMILKFENGSWSKVNIIDNRGAVSVVNSQELKAIKMISETQGYAVGSRDNLLTNPRGLFLQYEPKRGGWVDGQFDSAVENLDQVPLNDIEMISGQEGWALGQPRTPDWTFQRNPKQVYGNLLANVGGVLKLDTQYFSGNVNGAFLAIDLMPQGEGFVVGEGGFILQRTYDWRGLTNGTSTGYGTGTGYGSSYGTGTNGAMPTTYGPAGTVIPGGNPTNTNTYY